MNRSHLLAAATDSALCYAPPVRYGDCQECFWSAADCSDWYSVSQQLAWKIGMNALQFVELIPIYPASKDTRIHIHRGAKQQRRAATYRYQMPPTMEKAVNSSEHNT
uniref:Uncharacterized protein n=1 Tax=Anopheles gambiae TaxID=7165 RepID=A0A0E3W2D7_ANOGA